MDTGKVTPKSNGWGSDTAVAAKPSTKAKASKSSKAESKSVDSGIDLFKNSKATKKKDSAVSKTDESSVLTSVTKMARNAKKALDLVNPKTSITGRLKLGYEAVKIVGDSVKEYKKDSGGFVEGAKSFAKDTVSIFKQLVEEDKKADTGSKTGKDAKPKDDDTLEKIWGAISKSKSVTEAIDKVGDMGRKKILDEFKNVAIPTIKEWIGLGEKAVEKVAEKAGGLVDDVAAVATKVTGLGSEAGSLLSKLPGLASKALGAFGAAYSAFSIYKNFGKMSLPDGALNGAAIGAFAGALAGPIGITVGGIAGGLVGGALSFFKNSGKDKDQLARDEMRSGLQKMGMLDEGFGLTLADGSKYDMGKDGKFALSNLDGNQRRAYDVDLADERATQVVGWINPLAEAMAGENEKVKTDLVGYLTNAALSNATTRDEARANVRKFYEESKIDVAELATAVDSGVQQGRVKPDLGEAYLNGLVDLYAE